MTKPCTLGQIPTSLLPRESQTSQARLFQREENILDFKPLQLKLNAEFDIFANAYILGGMRDSHDVHRPVLNQNHRGHFMVALT